jgi:hypothetical protein
MSNLAVQAVIAYWEANRVRYLPGVDDEQVRAFEASQGVKLPDDVRCFYRTTNGTKVPLYGQDQDSYEFWRLSELAPKARESWAINFADYREMSWWYAFDATGRGGLGKGAVYLMGAEGRRPLLVARSFTEFLQLYVDGDYRLTPPGARAYHASVVEAP